MYLSRAGKEYLCGELHFDRFLGIARDTSQVASNGSGATSVEGVDFFFSRESGILTGPRWGQVALFKLNQVSTVYIDLVQEIWRPSSLAPMITVAYFVLRLAITYVEWRGATISVMLKEIWWRVVERARVATVHAPFWGPRSV
jgi:hypothetical protein